MLSTLFISVLSVEGVTLILPRVKRQHMGAYLCIASNGVPPSVSKRITLIVHCKYDLLSNMYYIYYIYILIYILYKFIICLLLINTKKKHCVWVIFSICEYMKKKNLQYEIVKYGELFFKIKCALASTRQKSCSREI